MKVEINISFIDKHSGKLLKAGEKMTMTNERVAEVMGENPHLVTVIVEPKKKKE